MSRPRVKHNRIHPVIIHRIKQICYDNLRGFFERHLKDSVSFDFPRFASMMREDWCHESEEVSLYLRLAAVERQVREQYAMWDLIDEAQVQWAVERSQGVK